MSEQQLSKKADMALADLANGGLLETEQSNRFIQTINEQPTILSAIRVIPMNSPTREINKIGIGSRMLHAGVESTALAVGDRTKATTGKITLSTKKVMAELRLPYEVIEDNIERGNIENTLITLIASRAAIDLEELALLGDTASGDAYLALHNGFLKMFSTNVYDAVGVGAGNVTAVDPNFFNTIVKTMPKKYRRNKASLRHYVPSDVEQDYRNDQAKRGTGLGDATLTGDTPLKLYSSRVEGVAMMPDANALFTNPQNLIMGIQRDISLESEKMISEQVVKIVVSARIAFAIEEENAGVKVTNIGVAGS